VLPDRPSVAVLPFLPLDADPDQQVIARGLSQDISVRLARTRWLFVTARASADRFSLAATDAAEIGRSLGVRYLLHGTVLRSGRRLRVTVTLSDTMSDREIWAERLYRQIDGLFEVQDEIADLVVSGVEAEIEFEQRRRAWLQPLASLDAWSAYHRAVDLIYRHTPEGREEAVRLLDRAQRLDPQSSRIMATQSLLHWQSAFIGSTDARRDEIARALETAQQAVALDPLEPQGHWALGRAIRFTVEDIEQSVEEFRTAVELSPSFANAHYTLGVGLKLIARHGEALESLLKARRISPYDPLAFAHLSQVAELNVFLGRPREALGYIWRAARDPRANHHIQAIAAWCHELAGEHAAATRYAEGAKRQRPGYSRAEYFQLCPFREPQRSLIERALVRAGL